jgi:hypothetical protein
VAKEVRRGFVATPISWTSRQRANPCPTEFDVDLFAQDDLYDINIIGSMLKAWLRELPDELFPKDAQERISRECAGAETVPQMLIDELSNLSPFNYYSSSPSRAT